MKLPRRNFLHLAAGAAALPVVSRMARAQAYPERPVHVIVGFPPGGTADIVARLMSQWSQRIESRVALLIGRRGSRERHRLRSSINHVRRLAGTLRQFIPDPPQSAAPVGSSSPTMARTFCRFDWPQRARQGRHGRATVQFTMLGAMPRWAP